MVFPPTLPNTVVYPLLFPFVLHVSIFSLLIALITCNEDHNLRSSLYRIQAKRGMAAELELACCSVERHVAMSQHSEHYWHHTRLQFKWVQGNLFPGVERPGRDAENLTSRLGMDGTEITPPYTFIECLFQRRYFCIVIKFYPDCFFLLTFGFNVFLYLVLRHQQPILTTPRSTLTFWRRNYFFNFSTPCI